MFTRPDFRPLAVPLAVSLCLAAGLPAHAQGLGSAMSFSLPQKMVSALSNDVVAAHRRDLDAMLADLMRVTDAASAAAYSNYLDTQMSQYRSNHERLYQQAMRGFKSTKKSSPAQVTDAMRQAAADVNRLAASRYRQIDTQMQRVQGLYPPLKLKFDDLRNLRLVLDDDDDDNGPAPVAGNGGAAGNGTSLSTTPTSVTAGATANLGNNVSVSTECTAGGTASGSGGVDGNNVGGSASVGNGVVCTNTLGYADPNGYAQLEGTCQAGTFANAQGTAGANGASFCGDASTGASCSASVSGEGRSAYGGGGGSAGVSGGGQGIGACGGFTFTGGAVNIKFCGSLAFEVGVDVCVNGSVNYKNIVKRMEPFASRAVAQAAKCAASGKKNCFFTGADLLANAAAPYYRRTRAFFTSAGEFSVASASTVWNDSRATAYRTANYASSAARYTGNKLKGTAYDTWGVVRTGSGQILDVGTVTGMALLSAGGSFVSGMSSVGSGIVSVGNAAVNGASDAGDSFVDAITSNW